MKKVNITILDGYCLNPGDLNWDEFKKLGELTVYDRTAPSEVVARSADAEVILTNKTVLDAPTLQALPKLRYIGVLATGYNVVDVDAAHRLGITVTNIPAYSTMSVAQMVFAHLLTVTNHVEHYAQENRDGRWSHCLDFCYADTTLTELAGKTFGIIGLGHIGMAVARIALAFGMKVVAFTSKEAENLPDGVAKTDLDTLLASSDVVSLHCPLNDATRHLINEDRLRSMKRDAILINTGRGPLVDEIAVAQALCEDRLGVFCADVLSSEPPGLDNPLLSAPRCFITPHIAWATREARGRLCAIAAANIRDFLAGNPSNTVS